MTDRFSGWYRERRGVWRKLVDDAPNYSDCWGALLDAVAPLPSGDSVVLRSFEHPGKPPAGIQEARRVKGRSFPVRADEGRR